jgi:hypothetical protein
MNIADLGAVLAAFDYSHLPLELQVVSKHFHDLAHLLAASDMPRGLFFGEGLVDLLNAKDNFVRAALSA